MVWLTQIICYRVHIPLLMRQMVDAEENLTPTIFDIPDSTVIFCELQHA